MQAEDVSPGTISSTHPPDPGMVWVPGGEFEMGSNDHYPEESPVHRVRVDGFWIDRFQVTNASFKRFVRATGYVTLAEREPDPTSYPSADPALLTPGSTVFVAPDHPVDLRNPYEWWRYLPGADWRHPRGRATTSRGLSNHPVVHVAWEDVEAYAAWAGKELPTEAEWEYAARGGLEGAAYVWGDDFTPDGRQMANTWQGEFPHQNDVLDGYEWTAPVGSFPANGFGLFDMAGNVWEWTSDWYQDHGAISHTCCTIVNPRGGERETSSRTAELGEVPAHRKVMKGGSHLCAPNYCRRYRPAARMPQEIDTSTSHLGFRCVARQPDASLRTRNDG